ncbi:50S ribosomal protein L11 [Saccharomonospora xinjiangensis]|uniref:Large ribosomal subunit protein uL11 n=1 Tax=Saccharomonospora xinjiangensis XJ-54 TaxID=882086 RepID=I0V3N3_9PSEU|nr:50S ribosomal protein L11 [Saccharomonospora xinjiangensis]EID54736.1 ribosomal protein L11 [Saccharomonospora xinjiangensis XJ-54]QBQ62304.1 50S ribosomal protein L11 [Saccharomonospora xinjiangensis]
MATSKAKKKFETTLQLPAGEAPVPDIGKALGQTGVNLVEVKRAYDAATAGQRGEVVPVVITVFEDRSFSMRYKTPPTSHLIRKELGGPGSARPGHEAAGVLSRDALRRVAERKLPDLNTSDVEAAMRIVAGTARSMGVTVEG